MGIGHRPELVREKLYLASTCPMTASPPAPPTIVATAKKNQDEQYNDEERGVIYAAPPSISPLKDTQTLASLGSSENRHL
jgi:hypothetical protein